MSTERSQATLLRYHVVRITAEGYSRLSSHATHEAGAAETLAACARARDPVVLRDGTTGKRFSVAEIRSHG